MCICLQDQGLNRYSQEIIIGKYKHLMSMICKSCMHSRLPHQGLGGWIVMLQYNLHFEDCFEVSGFTPGHLCDPGQAI